MWKQKWNKLKKNTYQSLDEMRPWSQDDFWCDVGQVSASRVYCTTVYLMSRNGLLTSWSILICLLLGEQKLCMLKPQVFWQYWDICLTIEAIKRWQCFYFGLIIWYEVQIIQIRCNKNSLCNFCFWLWIKQAENVWFSFFVANNSWHFVKLNENINYDCYY